MIQSRRKLRYAHVVAWTGLTVMIAALYFGLQSGQLWTELRSITGLPWGVVTLIDIYVGFVLFSCWIVWREPSRLAALAWIALIMLLGNVVACLYVIAALNRSGSDAEKFWLGAPRAPDANER